MLLSRELFHAKNSDRFTHLTPHRTFVGTMAVGILRNNLIGLALVNNQLEEVKYRDILLIAALYNASLVDGSHTGFISLLFTVSVGGTPRSLDWLPKRGRRS